MNSKVPHRLQISPARAAAPVFYIILILASSAGCNKQEEANAKPPEAAASRSGRATSESQPAVDATQGPSANPQNPNDPGAQLVTPISELQGIVAEIHKSAPPGTGNIADAAARNHFLSSRDKLSDFIKKYPGSDESEYAHILRATLSIAGSATGEATVELREVMERLGDAVTGKRAALRMEGLVWLAQTDPPSARKYLKQIIDSKTDFSRRALKLYRLADAFELLKIGSPLPPFAAVGMDQKPIVNDTIRGKAALFYFWSSAVKDSLDGIKTLRKLNKESGGKDLEIISVCLDGKEIRSVPGGGEPMGEGADAVRRFVDEYHIPGLQVYDSSGYDGILAETFVINVTPGSVLVDKNGVVRGLNVPVAELYTKTRDAIEGR
ncbi:MAG: TlpA family protein disulfide reductase [Planctomycetes bacterium]|nr:TlpA family protein disulfide reductase [Planctomycetota bacterium]